MNDFKNGAFKLAIKEKKAILPILIQGTEEVKMTNLYRNIARYRDTHPRRHTIPLDANQKRLINTFVERYKQEL